MLTPNSAPQPAPSGNNRRISALVQALRWLEARTTIAAQPMASAHKKDAQATFAGDVLISASYWTALATPTAERVKNGQPWGRMAGANVTE